MSITGEGPNAEGAARPPVKVGAPVTDITSGILAALHHRAASGQGQLVGTSFIEAGIMHTYWQSAICFATGTSPGPMGSAHPLNGPYQAFPNADGWINVGAANQRNCERLLSVIVAPHLNTDPRSANNSSRMATSPPSKTSSRTFSAPKILPTGYRRWRKAAFPPAPFSPSPKCTPTPRRHPRNTDQGHLKYSAYACAFE